MNVQFYNNKSDSRKLSKNIVPLGGVVACMLKEPCEILYPVLKLKRSSLQDYAQCNYMFIPAFNRYYFVKCKALTGDMLEVEALKVDVAMTYASGIRALKCTIVRQEHLFNKFFGDNVIPIRANRSIQRVSVGTYDAGMGIYVTADGGSQNTNGGT